MLPIIISHNEAKVNTSNFLEPITNLRYLKIKLIKKCLHILNDFLYKWLDFLWTVDMFYGKFGAAKDFFQNLLIFFRILSKFKEIL